MVLIAIASIKTYILQHCLSTIPDRFSCIILTPLCLCFVFIFILIWFIFVSSPSWKRVSCISKEWHQLPGFWARLRPPGHLLLGGGGRGWKLGFGSREIWILIQRNLKTGSGSETLVWRLGEDNMGENSVWEMVRLFQGICGEMVDHQWWRYRAYTDRSLIR